MHIQELGQHPVLKIKFKAKDLEDAKRIAELRLEGTFFKLLRLIEVENGTV